MTTCHVLAVVQVPQYETGAGETQAQLGAEDCLQIPMAVVHRYWAIIGLTPVN